MPNNSGMTGKGNRTEKGPNAIPLIVALALIIALGTAYNYFSGIVPADELKMSAEGVTVDGLSGIKVVPGDQSIGSLGELTPGVAYVQKWEKGNFWETDATNVYLVIKRQDLQNGVDIKIMSDDFSVSNMKLIDAWGGKADLYAKVFVAEGHFINIRTYGEDKPSVNINVRKSQNTDVMLSKEEIFLHDGVEKKYYFITMTVIDKVTQTL